VERPITLLVRAANRRRGQVIEHETLREAEIASDSGAALPRRRHSATATEAAECGQAKAARRRGDRRA
jgi:hypothetical protein